MACLSNCPVSRHSRRRGSFLAAIAVMFAASVAEVAHRRSFSIVQNLKHNPQKEKNAHRQYDHNK
jgi:hypothetical protein